MKILSLLLLLAVLASCGSTRKALHSFSSEVSKTEFFKKDSAGTSQAETSVKKVDSSHVIEKEESGWERETVEVITETFPTGTDTPAIQFLQGGAIPKSRTTTRTIREKGQKKTETTAQVAKKEERHQQQAQAAQTSDTRVKDTTAKVEAKSKQVQRSGLSFWQWAGVISLALAVGGFFIYRYRWEILFRLFGKKRPINDRT